MAWYIPPPVTCVHSVQIGNINILDQTTYRGARNPGVSIRCEQRVLTGHRHVRVHHLDKDKEDPLLRQVLSQRPEGGNRGRRRRIGGH